MSSKLNSREMCICCSVLYYPNGIYRRSSSLKLRLIGMIVIHKKALTQLKVVLILNHPLIEVMISSNKIKEKHHIFAKLF